MQLLVVKVPVDFLRPLVPGLARLTALPVSGTALYFSMVTTAAKILMALCAAMGLVCLVAVMVDPSSPLWGTLIAMVLIVASQHPRVRQLGRRNNSDPK